MRENFISTACCFLFVVGNNKYIVNRYSKSVEWYFLCGKKARVERNEPNFGFILVAFMAQKVINQTREEI